MVDMEIKVGITGQSGFMGRHLYNYLSLKKEELNLVSFDRSFFENANKLEEFVRSCDVIIHIAALNRHESQEFIYKTNIDLVNKLIYACESTDSKPKIIFSSSTQEDRDNLYGKSKRDGKNLLKKWAERNETSVECLIIPNVFGPFGKPFHNSFIATFCHQIVNGEEPKVFNDSAVNLIYINELCELFYEEVKRNTRSFSSKLVEHTSSYKVSEILSLLYQYKEAYMDNGEVPNVPTNSFELNLFHTFTSFIPKSYFPRNFTTHTDKRGAFVEIIRVGVSGQFSYSSTISGITRGNHYHTRKLERFAVIKGKASIKLRKVDSDEVIEYLLDGDKPSYVDMPIWYTHNITNIGEEELVTLFWINEPYNPDDADTYFIDV